LRPTSALAHSQMGVTCPTPEPWRSWPSEVKRDVGVPDVIINNAGAGRWLFIEETDAEEFAAMTAVPYTAAFLVTRAFIVEMLARRSGRVVVVNSPVSQLAWPGALGYAGSRWALRGFTAALRSDLRRTGVGMTEVTPGKVSSDYFDNNPAAEERIPTIVRIIPTLSAAEVAAAICAGVERERRTVITPLVLRLILAQARLFPAVNEWVVWRSGARRTAIRVD
jgi:short-subunit dehydrogenase